MLPDESVSIITSQVASSNAQAARADVANQEDADKILQQLGELIRNNAEMAESAQANISPRMVFKSIRNGLAFQNYCLFSLHDPAVFAQSGFLYASGVHNT